MVRKFLNDEVLPRHLSNLEKIASSSTSGWLASTPGPTIADFTLAQTLKALNAGPVDGIPPGILTPYPAILAFLQKFAAIPSVAAYYKAQ